MQLPLEQQRHQDKVVMVVQELHLLLTQHLLKEQGVEQEAVMLLLEQQQVVEVRQVEQKQER